MADMQNRSKLILVLFAFCLIAIDLTLLNGSSKQIPKLSFSHEIPTVSLKDNEVPLLSFEEKPIPIVALDGVEVQEVEPKKTNKKRIERKERRPVEQKKRQLSQPQIKRQPVKQKDTMLLDLTKTAPDTLPMSKKTKSPLLLSSAWKEMMKEDFYKKIKYVSNIVNQGEEDPQEKEDFIDRFQKNKEWIAASLASTTTVSDPSFDALMQRKERIDLLVKAQQQADLLIRKMSMVKNVSDAMQIRLRLAVLYALNDLIGSSNQVPSYKKIEALVEEKTLIYGALKDQEYSSPESTNILNVELMHEIKRLKKRLAAESKKHTQEYEAIKKELEEKEKRAEVAEIKSREALSFVEEKDLTLKMQAERVKEAELKTALMQQMQKETEFNAHSNMEMTNKRSIQLEIALAEAEKEKLSAENSLRKALSDYKEVKEFVSFLQKQTDELSTDNQTLLLNLERTVQQKSTLALEKQHTQRQYDRLKKEIEQLQSRIADQKKQMNRLHVTLEKASHDKKYVLSQVATMKSMQKRQKNTQAKLQSRVLLLNNRLEASNKKNLELEQLIITIKDDYRSTLNQISEIEELRKESIENGALLRKEVSRLLKAQTHQKVRSQELASLLEREHISKKEKKILKKETLDLNKASSELEAELNIVQELYETEQLQQNNLTDILQELKVQIFDQEGQLEELEKRSALRASFVGPSKEELIDDEGQVIALKRKNRALKNKIKSLERSMQSKNASKEDEYFAKDHTKVIVAEAIDNHTEEKEDPLLEAKTEIKENKEQKKSALELEELKSDIKKEELLPQKKRNNALKQAERVEKKVESKSKEKTKQVEKATPARPMDEIVGSFGSGKKASASPVKQVAAVKKSTPGKKEAVPILKPAVIAPKPSLTVASGIQASMPLPSAPSQSPPVSGVADNSNEYQKGMKHVVDAIQKGIYEDPEGFKNAMIEAASNITQADVDKALGEIEAMSPEEQKEFTGFLTEFMGSMPPEMLSGEMFQPKK